MVDTRIYKKAKQRKEQKASTILGWINIALGLGTFLANWVSNHFFW